MLSSGTTHLAILALLSALTSALPGPGPGPSPSVLDKRIVHGQCGIHVIQYQKNENGVGGEYEYTVQIKDAVGAIVSGCVKRAVADLATTSIDSQLAHPLKLTSGSADKDPVTFAYDGQHWSSSEGQCSVGGYDGGSRQMDCGFTC